jgi:hypothetical protein
MRETAARVLLGAAAARQIWVSPRAGDRACRRRQRLAPVSFLETFPFRGRGQPAEAAGPPDNGRGALDDEPKLVARRRFLASSETRSTAPIAGGASLSAVDIAVAKGLFDGSPRLTP